MPKAKPVSLHPLTFDQAMKAILGASSPTPPGPAKKKRKAPAKS